PGGASVAEQGSADVAPIVAGDDDGNTAAVGVADVVAVGKALQPLHQKVGIDGAAGVGLVGDNAEVQVVGHDGHGFVVGLRVPFRVGKVAVQNGGGAAFVFAGKARGGEMQHR